MKHGVGAVSQKVAAEDLPFAAQIYSAILQESFATQRDGGKIHEPEGRDESRLA
jgi:hypothetical protein